IVGVTADGKIGHVTLDAVYKMDSADIVNKIYDERMRFLRSLRTWPTFGKGWTSRCNRGRKLALSMVQQYPKGKLPPPIMAQIPAPDETNTEVIQGSAKAPDPSPAKPMTKSRTVWGGIISMLSGIGGTISGFFGYLNNPYTLTAFIIIVAIILIG